MISKPTSEYMQSLFHSISGLVSRKLKHTLVNPCHTHSCKSALYGELIYAKNIFQRAQYSKLMHVFLFCTFKTCACAHSVTPRKSAGPFAFYQTLLCVQVSSIKHVLLSLNLLCCWSFWSQIGDNTKSSHAHTETTVSKKPYRY